MGGWVDDTLVIMDDQAEGIVLDEERVIHGFEDKSLGECVYRVLVHLGGNMKTCGIKHTLWALLKVEVQRICDSVRNITAYSYDCIGLKFFFFHSFQCNLTLQCLTRLQREEL